VEAGGIQIQRLQVIAAALTVLFLPSPALAASLSDLAAQVNRAVAGGLSQAEEEQLIGALGEFSVDVANRYDQWVRTGAEDARAGAAGLSASLLPLLERLHNHHQGRIDRAQADIIAKDGNPEVLYDQPWWQLDRGFALATTGQLCWLYYRHAMLHPKDKEANKSRLKKAVEGFTEFVYSQDQKLRDESLLGRALAERELGEFKEAIGDLEAILEKGNQGALYWPARLTLAEVRVGAGDTAAALNETQRLINDARAAGLPMDVVNQAKLLRFQALATSAGKGGAVGGEAANLSRELSQLGPVWSKRVRETALAAMKDPRAILGSNASSEWIAAENLASEERFKEAIPAYEAVLKSTSTASRENMIEARHRLGVCYFRLGNYVEAEKQFRQYLNQAPKSPLAPEAAYLRFRAAEGIYRARAAEDTKELFVGAVEAFTQGYPKHENIHEGLFRLGEMRQAERRFQEAADAYAGVKGTPAFQARAASAEMQCLADLLLNAPEGSTKEWADGLRARAGRAYTRFEQAIGKDAKGKAILELRGRTVLAKGMVEAAGPAPKIQETMKTLEAFETRYPTLTDLHAIAIALRLAGESSLARLDAAEQSMKKLVAAGGAGVNPKILEIVARRFLRNAGDAAGQDDAAAKRWAALGATTFDQLVAQGGTIPTDAKIPIAQYYMENKRFDDAARVYAELTKENPKSKSALRNAAMVAAQRSRPAEAAEYWSRLAMLLEVASPPWYDARLQAARSQLAAGKAAESCGNLKEVDAFRPDLRDPATRQQYAETSSKACPKSS
jgi:tetratricopeptide (TPR) repeat protein